MNFISCLQANVPDGVAASRSQRNQRDPVAQQPATVTTRYGRVTVGPTYANLSADAFLEVMKCLGGLDCIKVLRTCKHFLSMSYTRCFWQAMCKLQVPYLQNDPFESLIQSQTQSCARRESAYHKLYQLRLRTREPWVEKLLIDSRWFQPADRECGRVAALPNGNIILTYRDLTCRNADSAGSLWSPLGEYITELGDRWPFEEIEILPDGNFVTRSFRGEVCAWSSTGRKLATHLSTWNDEVRCVAALPNGTIAMGCADGNVRIWSRNFDLLSTFDGHTRGVQRLVIRPDGGFVSISGDCTAIIWSADGDRVATLTGDTTLLIDPVSIPQWERDLWPRPVGSHIAVLTNGNIAACWTRAEAALPAGYVYRYSPENGWKQRAVRIWTPDGRQIWTLPFSSSCVRSIFASPNGGLVVDRNGHSDFYSFSERGTRYTQGIKVPVWTILCMAVSSRDGRVVTASDDRIIRVWTPQGALIATFKKLKHWINCVTWLSNGDILVGYKDGSARVWTMDVGLLMQEERSTCVVS